MSGKTSVKTSSEEQVNKPSLRAEKTSDWSKLWLTLIPAYAYFFGYSSFKIKLEHLGFESPDISTAPGEVYYQAFHAAIYMGSKIVPRTRELIGGVIADTYLPFLIISVFAGFAIYFAQKYVAYRTKREAIKTRPPKVKASQHAIISLWFFLYMNIAGLAVIPGILTAMYLFFVALLPPALIGISMADDQLAAFDCPETTEEIKDSMQCGAIATTNGRLLIGIIMHIDDRFLYLLMKDRAKAIPIDEIQERDRVVVTGKKAD